VVANAANARLVLGELTTRSAGYDVAVRLRGPDDAGLIAVQGPASARIVAAAIEQPVEDLRYYSHRPARVASAGGAEVLLARTGYTGEDGFELFCTAADAPVIWAVLLDLGERDGLVPAGLACRDTLRLEAGMALYGHELSVEHDPYEARLGRVVHLDKPGDFVGKAALRRRSIDVTEVLVGLRCPGRRVPRAGYAVTDASGRPVGHVTSGAPSPTLGVPIAMAYVEAASAVAGTELRVDMRGTAEPAHVVELPFYRRERPGS